MGVVAVLVAVVGPVSALALDPANSASGITQASKTSQLVLLAIAGSIAFTPWIRAHAAEL